MLRYFEDQAFQLTDTLVILDVDGTIVPDCGWRASAPVIGKVDELKAQGNEVYLCSNSRRSDYADRLAAMASQLGVGACPGSLRKPSMAMLQGLDRRGRAVVVIGDKDLTDGLLARRAGAQFIKVRRKLDPADRLVSRVTNLVDQALGPIALLLWDRLFAPWRGS